MFQQMLRTGAEVQEQNVKAMQGIFEAFWTDPTKAAAELPGRRPGSGRSRSPARALPAEAEAGLASGSAPPS